MKPIGARLLITLIVSAVAITVIVVVNSRYHGSFLAGLLLIVLPLLVLSFSLPYLIVVRCECGGRMRFRFFGSRQVYSFTCERCKARHEWEGSSSGSMLE